MTQIEDDLTEFYRLLSDLEKGVGGKRTFESCNSKMKRPQRGMYFFFEDGELKKTKPSLERVVRVGTHSLKKNLHSTLWKRMSEHQGTATGGGNQRGSIFRRLVGAAIIQKDDLQSSYPFWDKRQSASTEIRANERPIEVRVSNYIRATRVLLVNIPDEPGPKSDRGVIEKNSIALLSNRLSPADPSSDKWLGRFSTMLQVKNSGLLDNDHTEESYDDNFLQILSSYVDSTMREC